MTKGSGILQTRIVWKDAMQVVGEKMKYVYSADIPPSENGISLLWSSFNKRVGEIDHCIGGAYGLKLIGNDCDPGGSFDYMAAVGVSHVEQVPKGMSTESFSGGLYCVVTRQGVIDEIGAAFNYYFGEWLPQSDYEPRSGVEFEYYDDRYRGNGSQESIMELWFPIQPVQAIPLENRVGSVFVHVTDLRRAAEWYSRLLGLPLIEERLNGGPVYWFEFQGTHLILDSNMANQQNPEWHESMMPRIMFPARDIDEAYGYMKEKAEPFSEPERHGSMAYFNFHDPEGNAHMVCWSIQQDEELELQAQSPILPRIGGVFVDVEDMRTTAGWYTELLGLPLDEENAARSIYSVPVTRGAALLLDQNRYLNQDSFTQLFYFETEDFEAALTYVRSNGFELVGEPNHFEDLSEFVLLDPDGNRIVIAQMLRP